MPIMAMGEVVTRGSGMCTSERATPERCLGMEVAVAIGLGLSPMVELSSMGGNLSDAICRITSGATGDAAMK